MTARWKSAVLLSTSVIVALTWALFRPGPGGGVGLLIVLCFPPSLLLIAWGSFVGARQLPERGYPIRDVLILALGGAVAVGVILWIVFVAWVLPALSGR